MPGLGTIINAAAIVVGGLIGVVAGKRLQERYQKTVMTAMALCIIAMSLSGVVAGMLHAEADGTFSVRGTFMLIFSLVLGGAAGELIDLDRRFVSLGKWLKEKSGSGEDAAFVRAFLTSSMTVCIGAMAVVGSVMDGISGDHSVLVTKAIMDFVIILLMASSLGKGCIFSAVPVAAVQGTITLLSRLIAPLMNDAATANLGLVGNVLILCVGVNLLIPEGKHRVKVANLMPAILFAVGAAYIPFLMR